MQNILTIDCGNSSTKLAVWAGDELVEYVSQTAVSAAEIEALIARHDVGSAIIGSVVGNLRAVNQALSNTKVPLTKLSAASSLPITIDYATPATLGADRIAAAAGAYTQCKSMDPRDCLVVDIGTAITYDLVSAGGHFFGGNIAPGIGMRLRSLHQFTSALPEIDSHGDLPALLGNSTETALRCGALYGVVGELTYYHAKLDSPRVVLTGGWCDDVARFLDFEVIIDKHLVCRGLKDILLAKQTQS